MELFVISTFPAISFELFDIYNKKNIPEKISDTIVNKNLIFYYYFLWGITFKITKKLYFAKYSFQRKSKTD